MRNPKSKKPKKQRKYIKHLKLHERKKVFSAHLSKELRKEIGKRALTVRKNDKVKVVRGKFKGTQGKVTGVDTYKQSISVDSIKRKKADGTEIFVPIKPGNVIIVELDASDTNRAKGKKVSKGVKDKK